MKNSLKFLFFATLSLVFSCSSENDVENIEDTLNAVSFQGPVISQCTGFGIFVDTHGQQYDCGWKRGYEDWVFHYNSVATSEGVQACSTLRIGTEEETDEINGTTYVTSVKTITFSVDNSAMIINNVQTLYQEYYDNLTANRNNSFFNQGQFDGYNAGRGQEPYVANGSDCGDSDSDGILDIPFPWEEDEEDEEQPIG